MSPPALGKKWAEQQEMVLLGEDYNQNGHFLVLDHHQNHLSEGGEEAETLGLGVLSQPLGEPRPRVRGLIVCTFECVSVYP